MTEQESIPVGCVPFAAVALGCVFPVSGRGMLPVSGLIVLSALGCVLPASGGGGVLPASGWGGGGVCPGDVNRMTDRRLWKYYLAATSLRTVNISVKYQLGPTFTFAVFNFHDKFKPRKLNISCSANKLVFRFRFRFPGTDAHEEVYWCTNSILIQECIPIGCVPSATVAVCFRGGGFSTPPSKPLPGADPPGAGTQQQTPQEQTPCPLEQAPPGSRPPGAGTPPETCCKACWDTTCESCWDTTPLWTDTHL